MLKLIRTETNWNQKKLISTVCAACLTRTFSGFSISNSGCLFKVLTVHIIFYMVIHDHADRISWFFPSAWFRLPGWGAVVDSETGTATHRLHCLNHPKGKHNLALVVVVFCSSSSKLSLHCVVAAVSRCFLYTCIVHITTAHTGCSIWF